MYCMSKRLYSCLRKPQKKSFLSGPATKATFFRDIFRALKKRYFFLSGKAYPPTLLVKTSWKFNTNESNSWSELVKLVQYLKLCSFLFIFSYLTYVRNSIISSQNCNTDNTQVNLSMNLVTW